MSKSLVLYKTTTGEIISIQSAPPSRSILWAGDGVLAGKDLTGIDLAGHAREEVSFINISRDGKTMRRKVESWVDDTHVLLDDPAKILNGEVYWQLMKEEGPVHFTLQQTAGKVAEAKTQEGHDNIAALRITSTLPISPTTHYVDLVYLQIKSKVDQISYE